MDTHFSPLPIKNLFSGYLEAVKGVLFYSVSNFSNQPYYRYGVDYTEYKMAERKWKRQLNQKQQKCECDGIRSEGKANIAVGGRRKILCRLEKFHAQKVKKEKKKKTQEKGTVWMYTSMKGKISRK